MMLLAVLDLGGSFAAKEAVGRRSIGLAALGAGLFLAVFWVYISSLEVAELSSVTFGWIVFLQVGVVLLDRYRYHVVPARGAWLAIVVLLAAQAYLVLAPGRMPEPTRTAEPESPASITSADGPGESSEVPGESAEGLGESAEGQHETVEAVHDELRQLGNGECAGSEGGDQQCVPYGLVSGIGHVSPQRSYRPADALTTKT